jgi:hypothetical protein
LAQNPGQSSFEFLNVPVSARLSAMGGVNVSLANRDINFFYSNPAVNGDTLAGFASVNYQRYVADINHAAFAYSNNFSGIGNLTIGVQHMNYGSIKGFDQTGNETGELNAGETALVIGKSHTLGNYRLGASIKGIFSNLAGYRANAVALDLGGVFTHPQQALTVAIVIKNFGIVVSDYSGSASSKLPFDVQVGATFKPSHMPLRFSATAYNLVNKNLLPDDPALTDDDPSSVEKIFAHLNFAGEILLHRNVNLLLGYNYLHHKNLKLENAGGGAGLNLGFSASIKAVDFVVSRSGYVAGTASYAFTLSTNIHKYFTRR